MNSCICVQHIYQCWVVKHSSFIRPIHEWFFHLHAKCSTFINDQVVEQSFHLKHSLFIRPISEQFFHLNEVLQHICKAELLNTAHSWNQSLSEPFIHMQIRHICQCWVVKHCHSSNQFWVNLSFTCIMKHIHQSWVVKHSSFIKSVLRHDEGVIFTATPCNCSSFIESILKEPLHLYMTHLTMSSFSNKALLSKQFQGMMKMLFKPEWQCTMIVLDKVRK